MTIQVALLILSLLAGAAGWVKTLFQSNKMKLDGKTMDYLNDQLESQSNEIEDLERTVKAFQDHDTREKFTKEELAPIIKEAKEVDNEKKAIALVSRLISLNNRRL